MLCEIVISCLLFFFVMWSTLGVSCLPVIHVALLPGNAAFQNAYC